MKYALTTALVIFSIEPALADWKHVAARWPSDMPQSTKEWFLQQKNNNMICCSAADGYPQEWDKKEGHYWVYDDVSSELFEYEKQTGFTAPASAWRQIPDEAVLHNTGNPTGNAVIWYMGSRDPNTGYRGIRCFIPGAEG